MVMFFFWRKLLQQLAAIIWWMSFLSKWNVQTSSWWISAFLGEGGGNGGRCPKLWNTLGRFLHGIGFFLWVLSVWSLGCVFYFYFCIFWHYHMKSPFGFLPEKMFFLSINYFQPWKKGIKRAVRLQRFLTKTHLQSSQHKVPFADVGVVLKLEAPQNHCCHTVILFSFETRPFFAK